MNFICLQMVNLKLEKFDCSLNPLIKKIPLPMANMDEVFPLKVSSKMSADHWDMMS